VRTRTIASCSEPDASDAAAPPVPLLRRAGATPASWRARMARHRRKHRCWHDAMRDGHPRRKPSMYVFPSNPYPEIAEQMIDLAPCTFPRDHDVQRNVPRITSHTPHLV
jgi:hypothetical protein